MKLTFFHNNKKSMPKNVPNPEKVFTAKSKCVSSFWKLITWSVVVDVVDLIVAHTAGFCC